MNLHRLSLLVEFRRLGTLTAVAEAKLITHSAVSQQLAQLEKEIGYRLVEKSGRGLKLTDRGQLLTDYAEKMLTLANEATAALADRSAVTGVLRVACFQTALASLSAPVTDLLAKRHPSLRLEFLLADVIDGLKALADTQVDLTIGEQFPGAIPIETNTINRKDFHQEPLILASPARGQWQATPNLEDMRAFPFMLNPSYTPAGQWERSICHSYGFDPHVILESPAPLLQLRLVAQGMGVAFLPLLVLPEEPTDIRINQLPGHPTRTLFSAVRAGMEQHPKIMAFRQALETVTKDRAFCALSQAG